MRPQNILYASIFAAGLGFSSAACAANVVVISVDKTSQRMTVSVDGATRYVWPVSTGRPGFDTPNGTFHPFRLDQDHHSTVYDNAPMPDSIFFTKTGDAVHGFFDTPHLGMAVSHGCVRLSPANAAVLYGLVEQTGLSDTTVIVHGSVPTRNAPTVARRRTATPKQQLAEQRTPGAIEHDPLGQLIRNILEPLHPIAAARQPSQS